MKRWIFPAIGFAFVSTVICSVAWATGYAGEWFLPGNSPNNAWTTSTAGEKMQYPHTSGTVFELTIPSTDGGCAVVNVSGSFTANSANQLVEFEWENNAGTVEYGYPHKKISSATAYEHTHVSWTERMCASDGLPAAGASMYLYWRSPSSSVTLTSDSNDEWTASAVVE